MKKDQKSEIVESVKNEIETWVLEQKIVNLENTLSDTISFLTFGEKLQLTTII